MPRFSIEFDGADSSVLEDEFPNAEAARDAAVRLLGEYLQHHPEYAHQRHWRVDLKDHRGRIVLYVIVATVVAPPLPNLASYEL